MLSGGSLGVPSDTGPHAVQRIPSTSRDPPLVSPQTQAPILCGGSLAHPGILPWCPLRHRPPSCPEDPLDIPGFLPWCSLRHRPPCCPKDPLDIPGSSLGVLSDTGPHAVRRIPWTSRDPPLVSPQTQPPILSGGSLGHPGILPWCPLRHRPPCCPEVSLDILGSFFMSPQTQVPMLSGGSQDPMPANHSSSKLLTLGSLLGSFYPRRKMSLESNDFLSDTASTLVWCHCMT